MRKFHTPPVSKSKGKKLADLTKSFSPKPKAETTNRPKITSVVVIKTTNPQNESNYAQIEKTLIQTSGLPKGKNLFELVVVMSPVGQQPPQYPPFQKSYRLKVDADGHTYLEGGPLSFAGGAEPPIGSKQYQLNLVQDVDSGETWDIDDAEVMVVEGNATSDTSNFTGAPLDDKKPKVAKVTVIKTINDDITVSQTHSVQIEVQDLPPSIVPYDLKVVMTANSSQQPDQIAPRNADFTLTGGTGSLIEGTLTYAGGTEMMIQNNAYTLVSVKNLADSKNWQILDTSVNVTT